MQGADASSPSFGARLRRYRERAGLSQEELAERAGVSGQAISALKRGERTRPYPSTTRRLAEALGLAEEEQAELLTLVPRRHAAPARPRAAVGHPAPGDEPAPAPGFSELPVPLTPLIGRDADLARVAVLIETGTRLLTLTGPGGVGKTRLALQVASALREQVPDGVAFISLASVDDTGMVLSAVAQTVGVRESGNRPLDEVLQRALRGRRLVLVLDNCEHVLDGAAAAAALLESCPDLTILATSRAPLRVRGEQEYPVPPLALPSFERPVTVEEAVRSPAVGLFVDRAQAASPGFSLTEGNASAVAAICGRLDGLPLALELAAPRVKLLPPDALLARLHHALPLLTDGGRDLPSRQQTLRSAIAWSWSLLDEGEQALFQRLAVFAGGCTLDAAEAVNSPSDEKLDTLMRLGSLVDKSLLQMREVAGEPRYVMLETVREYAAACLAESGEANAVRLRHATHVLRLAQEAEPHLIGPDQIPWMRRLDRELDNMRAALGYLLTATPGDALRLATLLDRYWGRRGFQAEGRFWLDAALERVPPARDPTVQRLRAPALVADGVMTADLGEFAHADQLLAEAMAIYEALNDRAGVAATLDAMGEPAYLQGDVERSRAYRERALAMHREVGNRWATANALRSLATIATTQLDLDRASLLLEESTSLFLALGDHWARANGLVPQAGAAFFGGDRETALALLEDARRTSQDCGDDVLLIRTLAVLALFQALMGDKRRSARVWGAVETAFRRVGTTSASEVLSLPAFAEERAIIQDPAYADDIVAGSALSLDEAVALAMDGDGTFRP